MHTMATGWQHCSTEKAAPPFPELGFQSHLLPRPSCQGTVAGGMTATTIPGVSKTLINTSHSKCFTRPSRQVL